VITETQSSAIDIRDAMYNIVSASPYFSGWTFRRNKMLPVQTNLLPFMGIYLAEEIMTPDGDPGIGCVRFIHAARIGFSIIQSANDPDTVEHLVDQSFLKVMSLLWTDVKLMNVLHNSNPEGVGIEGVVRGSRRHVPGAPTSTNETPWFECQYEVNCVSRSEWYPDIPDDLNEIDVTVALNNADPSQVQPVTIKYMLDTLRAARRS